MAKFNPKSTLKPLGRGALSIPATNDRSPLTADYHPKQVTTNSHPTNLETVENAQKGVHSHGTSRLHPHALVGVHQKKVTPS
jgi:hypothetical protein